MLANMGSITTHFRPSRVPESASRSKCQAHLNSAAAASTSIHLRTSFFLFPRSSPSNAHRRPSCTSTSHSHSHSHSHSYLFFVPLASSVIALEMSDARSDGTIRATHRAIAGTLEASGPEQIRTTKRFLSSLQKAVKAPNCSTTEDRVIKSTGHVSRVDIFRYNSSS